MSLNADVTDDLDDTPVDDEIIQGPDAVNANQKPITITAVTKETPKEPTELTEAALKQIAAGDISFKIVEGNVAKVTSLGEIESNILAADGVSTKDAEIVQEAFGSLITESMPLGAYTGSVTRVNFKHVIGYMQSQIALEEASTVDKFKDFIDNGLADAIKTIDRLTEVYAPDVLSLANDVREHIASKVDAYTTSKNAVVLFNTTDGSAFLNLLTSNIDGIPFADIPQLSSKANVYANAVAGVATATKNKYLRALILGNQDGAVNDHVFEPSWAALYGTVPVTMANIAQFYLDEAVKETLETVIRNAKLHLENLQRLTSEAEGKADTYQGTADYVANHSTAIQEAFWYANETAAMFLSLAILSKSVLVLTELYDAL